MTMPIFTEEVKLITPLIGYSKRDGKIFYFNGQMPLFMHDEKDEGSFKMFMAQLYVVGNVPQSAINRAFGMNPINMKRWVKKYQNGGPAAFYNKERKRRATVMTKEVMDNAQLLLDRDIPKKEIADELEIKLPTLKNAIRTGKLHFSNHFKKKNS
ncbi:MAG: helix-turn-helix domain-containing protein [Candidatus Omnitrophica bacterium]|nr:helix-turn-helix domain-containing protein [Candidatus Omnitrophota bacterium]MBU1127855.1 helix-turn-helix domain-containing protein [Candidatus Omnitrophota bacterium]MBU1851526.1 helix-turn-helix domain-containing protein [Candidatus Omnitrophota bacterium]